MKLISQRAFLFLLLAAVLPLSGQDADHVHFQLTSNRTYSPGQKAEVSVWGHGIDVLEFRLYRINDPVKFFQKLADKHQFGGEARPLERELNWLEKFHNWKRALRYEIRDFFRGQFSAASRTRIRGWLIPPAPPKSAEQQPAPTEFAELPVLNPQQLVSRWKQPIAGGRYDYRYGTVPVELPGKGLFLLEAVHKQKRAYTILNSTEIGLISKVWPGHVLVFAQHRETGAPIQNLPVRIWVGQKEIIQLKTNDQGLAEARVQEARPEETILLAEGEKDFAVSGVASWNLSSDTSRYFLGYLYTDRPVYRPGHTVNFKGILRNNPGANYLLPSARQVQVEIQDAENHAVFQKALPVSASGTVHGSFTLPASAALGYYSLIVRAGEAEAQSGFHVEEYKKPEYEVRVKADVPRVVQGQAIRATIEARYYFGEPVTNAKVTWVVHSSTFWYPLYADEDEPDLRSEGEQEEYDYVGAQEEEQSGTLGAEGKLVITLPTKENKNKQDLRYRIEARVTDAAGREISGRGNVLATYGSFMVNARSERYVVEAGKTARWWIEARDYDGNRLAVPASVTLHRWIWRNNQSEKSPSLAAKSITTETGAAVPVDFSLVEPGSYFARVAARTPEGREVESTGWVWATGRGFVWGADRAEIQIIPDKKSYAPGETARVLVLGGKAGTGVLVTTEGNIVHSRRVLRPEETSFTVDVPILPEYAPNFFLNVAFLRDNQMFQGTKRINVPPVEHQLQVQLTPAKKEFKPGETASYSLVARDHRGNPVTGAEFSLGVVDEAIYAIRPEGARDILNFFYGSNYNRVSTSSSLSYYFSGESGKRAMELAGGGGDGRRRPALGQIKPERLVEPKIRKAFPDTAYWVANLTTGADGRAIARFDFPDALTTWRATTRGVTRDTKVGSAVERVVVRKNLLVRLAVPRFFTEGDEIVVSVLAHNYLTNDKMARVSLTADGAEILEGSTRDVLVPSRGEIKVDWRIRAKPGQEIKVLGKALTDEESDAMELTLPVKPFGVKQVLSAAGSTGDANAELDAEIAFPQNIPPHSRTLEVSVSPSIAGALFGALDYLTSFPYGCTEQTMSSFLPNIIVARALKELKVRSNVDEAALQKKIREGMERLRDFQHEDGGWGWWKSDESHTFMTAYVLAGLVQAKAAGFDVPADELQRAQVWLRAAFDRENRALPDLRAYVAYALALSGSKDTAVLNAVWERRNDMSPYGRALVGLALDAAGDNRAGEIAGQLEREAKSSDREAWWESPRDDLLGFHGDTSPEATAYAVKLLIRHRPQSPLLPKAAVWLMRNRSGGFYWTSTKQTAMVIYGLTDYLKMSGELQPNFSVALTVNGKNVLTKRFTAAEALDPQPAVVRFRANELPAGASRIHLSKTGAGRLYWSARGEFFSTDEKLTRTGSVQLNLVREYFKLVPQKSGENIVHVLEPFSGVAAPGDVLAVRLTISGGEWKYLHLEDPIPAGAELIERDDLYGIYNRPSWWYFDFTRRELRDDRAVFFETFFSRGQKPFVYLLKIVNPGRFRVSPARIQPMYQPQFLSTTESRLVEVR